MVSCGFIRPYKSLFTLHMAKLSKNETPSKDCERNLCPIQTEKQEAYVYRRESRNNRVVMIKRTIERYTLWNENTNIPTNTNV